MAERIIGEDGRIFADERTKIIWETIQAAEEVVKNLPPEGLNLEAELIYFDEEYRDKGWFVMLTQGTVIFTVKGAYWVSRRTRMILDVLRIPYHVGFPEEG